MTSRAPATCPDDRCRNPFLWHSGWVTILCYHTVEGGWRSPLAVTPEAFAKHCAWLARRRVVPLEEAVERIDRWGRLPRGMTALTFDDGFAGVYQHAWPVLAHFGLPATVFLVAQTLSSEGRAVDWAPTTPPGTGTLVLDQVLEMQAAGISFGSHSYAHHDLTTLDADECEHDLRASRRLLEDLLKRSVPYLAYPRGLHDDTVHRAAEGAGFSHAFSLPEGPEEVSRYAIPRAVIIPGNGVPTLRFKTSRLYLPLRRTPLWPALRTVARNTGLGLRLGQTDLETIKKN
ncbi:polysaccharide deacetylase family protein [soil metagenome]